MHGFLNFSRDFFTYSFRDFFRYLASRNYSIGTPRVPLESSYRSSYNIMTELLENFSEIPKKFVQKLIWEFCRVFLHLFSRRFTQNCLQRYLWKFICGFIQKFPRFLQRILHRFLQEVSLDSSRYVYSLEIHSFLNISMNYFGNIFRNFQSILSTTSAGISSKTVPQTLGYIHLYENLKLKKSLFVEAVVSYFQK